jgi:hypothetical protein
MKRKTINSWDLESWAEKLQHRSEPLVQLKTGNKLPSRLILPKVYPADDDCTVKLGLIHSLLESYRDRPERNLGYGLNMGSKSPVLELMPLVLGHNVLRSFEESFAIVVNKPVGSSFSNLNVVNDRDLDNEISDASIKAHSYGGRVSIVEDASQTTFEVHYPRYQFIIIPS